MQTRCVDKGKSTVQILQQGLVQMTQWFINTRTSQIKNSDRFYHWEPQSSVPSAFSLQFELIKIRHMDNSMQGKPDIII